MPRPPGGAPFEVADEPALPGVAVGAARSPGQWPVLGVIAVGGALGACARYGLARLWPTAPGHFPWATFTVNALGCAVIGVFMVLVTEVRTPHRLVRPFFGTGVLGGFTTFSTYAVDFERLVDRGRIGTAFGYLAATVVSALVSVWGATMATRWATRWATRQAARWTMRRTAGRPETPRRRPR
ncbi:MAG: fluoride efflux transporter CrcB [Streptomycetaceae bacterium]|nr:fluoride efflux transporter CrcB [Streptomycetaceae bacterium]